MATTDDTGSRRIRVVPDLRGWDEIAAALGCSVRTARRYAKRADDPLPVRRLADGRVLAWSAKVASWAERNMRVS